jgi:hypothetical protein
MIWVGHESCSRDDKGAIMVTRTTTSATNAWCSMLLKM